VRSFSETKSNSSLTISIPESLRNRLLRSAKPKRWTAPKTSAISNHPKSREKSFPLSRLLSTTTAAILILTMKRFFRLSSIKTNSTLKTSHWKLMKRGKKLSLNKLLRISILLSKKIIFRP